MGIGTLNEMAREFKREKIQELLNLCTEPQVGMFNRMYKSIDSISEAKMDRAYDQCLETIKKNKKVVKTDLQKKLEKITELKQHCHSIVDSPKTMNEVGIYNRAIEDVLQILKQ